MSTSYIRSTFGELPGYAARRYGEREGLVFEQSRYTFKEIDAQVELAALALLEAGVRPGDHVCLWLLNCADWVFLSFGLARMGAVQVPINTRFRTHDLQYVLRQSDSTTLITHAEAGGVDYLAMVREVVGLPESGHRTSNPEFPALERVIVLDDAPHAGTLSWLWLKASVAKGRDGQSDPRLARIADSIRLEDPAFIMYTSGTTGFPKGAVHDHRLLRNLEERAFRMAITRNDTILNYLPLFHVFGYSEGVLMSLLTGARQIITERFVPDESLDLIEFERVTIVHGFEAHAKGLTEAQLERPRDLSSLRTGLFAAGMHSATPVIRRAAEVLAPLHNIAGFGMTEVWIGVCLGSLGDDLEHRTETSGFPGVGYQVRIVDPESLAPLRPDQPGELQVKGDHLMQGYYNKPEETAAAYTDDGWFRTGDMAVWRHDGYMRFLGRYKDMLKVGGENVDPMEVEGLLLGHPQINQVAVVGAPDERLSEVAVAFVQPEPNARISEERVIDYCKGKVASFKIPRRVIFVSDFPMTASGKIRKVELRERLASGG